MTVAPRHQRVRVAGGVERVRGPTADPATQLTMFLLAVIASVTEHVVLLHERYASRLALVVGDVTAMLAGALAATLGAVVASDLPQLFEEHVVDFEVVLGVGLGVILQVAVG